LGALRFILRRLAFSVALILGVSFILFALINAIGNPIQILLAETPGVSEEMIAALSKFYGVDGNFIDRYLSWLWAVVRFDSAPASSTTSRSAICSGYMGWRRSRSSCPRSCCRPWSPPPRA